MRMVKFVPMSHHTLLRTWWWDEWHQRVYYTSTCPLWPAIDMYMAHMKLHGLAQICTNFTLVVLCTMGLWLGGPGVSNRSTWVHYDLLQVAYIIPHSRDEVVQDAADVLFSDYSLSLGPGWFLECDKQFVITSGAFSSFKFVLFGCWWLCDFLHNGSLLEHLWVV